MTNEVAAYEVEIENANTARPDDVRYMGEKVAPVRIHYDKTSHPGYRLEISEFWFDTKHFNAVWEAMRDAQKFVHKNGGTALLSVNSDVHRSLAKLVATFKEGRAA